MGVMSAELEAWLERLETLHPKKIDLGLARIGRVLDRLSLRMPPYRSIVIGGTNGKGSCVAMLESLYLAGGYRTGAFTSPHLWRFNERIRVDGIDADSATVVALFERIERARGEISLSYFEFSTAAALLNFARSEVDVALLEVGLGGRLDAVNAIDADASLIASIDLDHQEWLGTTREAIGHEKAGIMRCGRPAVVAERNPPESLLIHAADIDARLRRLGADFDFDTHREQWIYRSESAEVPGLPCPGFGGREQVANAAGCLAVVESLQSSLPLDRSVWPRGIERARPSGRIEERDIGGVRWIFDVAHNPAAARVLAEALERRPVRGRTFAVVAMMQDKDHEGVLGPLMHVVRHWLLTRAGGTRGAAPESLAAVLAPGSAASIHLDAVAACESARRRAAPGDRVLVFGSFYLVGPAMSALGLYSAGSQAGSRSATWTGV